MLFHKGAYCERAMPSMARWHENLECWAKQLPRSEANIWCESFEVVLSSPVQAPNQDRHQQRTKSVLKYHHVGMQTFREGRQRLMLYWYVMRMYRVMQMIALPSVVRIS